MNYLLTVAYANQKVLALSYDQLNRTMVTKPLPVLMWDNCYPMNWVGFADDISDKFGFKYLTDGENIGLYAAWNQLLSIIPEDCDKVILYDGDNFPTEPDWHLALLKVLDSPDVVHATLMNQTIYNEFKQRPSDLEIIEGVECLVTKQAMTNTVCAFKKSFLRECGGVLGGKKYYGGNEIVMWPYYKGRKWVFLTKFWEDKGRMMALHDWQYQQYKSLYAHGNLDMSFDAYIKTNPQRIDDINKYLWG